MEARRLLQNFSVTVFFEAFPKLCYEDKHKLLDVSGLVEFYLTAATFSETLILSFNSSDASSWNFLDFVERCLAATLVFCCLGVTTLVFCHH